MTLTPKEALREINKQPNRSERKEARQSREKEEEDFDIDEALNSPTFVEYLSKFPDAEDLDMSSNNKEIKKRYFRFKDQKELSGSLKDVFIGQIELESGIKMSREDFASVDEYMEKLSVENPAKLEKILSSRRVFERSVVELQKTQAEISEILGKLDQSDIERKIEDLTYIQKNGFFKTLFNKEIRDRKKDILKKYDISGEDVESALTKEKQSLESLRKLDEVQDAVLKQFLRAQQELLSKEFEPLQQARQKVLEKIMESLAIINAKPKEDMKLGEVDAVAQKLRTVKESGNYIPEYQENLDNLERDLEEMAQKLLQEKINSAVESTNENKIRTLEKNIKSVFDKMTVKGLLTPENKNLIFEKLEELANKESSVPKKLLIKRIIIKLK